MHTRRASEAITAVLSELVRTRSGAVVDSCLLGSISGHYGWTDTKLIDADIWVYAGDRRSPEVREWLKKALAAIGQALTRHFPDVEVVSRAIDGPYKPQPKPGQECILLHVLLDDEESYSRRGECTKFSWRKYRPFVNPELLFTLSPKRLTIDDVFSDRWGLLAFERNLKSGRIDMPELDLDSGDVRAVVFERDTFEFREFCTYSTMMSARNRARMLQKEEADTLANRDFANWYKEEYADEFPIKTVDLKERISQGFDITETNREISEQALYWNISLQKELMGGG